MAADLSFSVLDKHSSAEKVGFMGGKAGNLYLLSNNNIPVPSWFCLGHDIFEDVIAARTDEINNILENINFEDQGSINSASQAISFLVEHLALPESLLEVISRAADKTGSSYFAIRSSAAGEDSASDSFAGQLDTFLYITAEKIPEFIKKCWASAFNPRLLSYLNIKGKKSREMKVAVIIQEMVESEASGVMFMANPAGSLNEVVVVAGYGLGEGIVADLVETDRYLYNRTDKSIDTFVEKKTSKIIFDKEKGFGTVKTRIETNGEEPVLSETQLLDLVETGLRIEKLYEHYQDIEWAFDASGKLYITQSRPITTIPRGEKTIYDNSNIVESYPGITSPLTFSYIKYAYGILFQNLLKSLGIPTQRIFDNPDVLKNMVGYIEGRVYYNLSNWYQMFRMIPGTKKYIEVWEEMMGISEKAKETKSFDLKYWLNNAPELSKVLLRLIWYFLTLDSQMKKFKHRFNSVYNEFWDIDFDKISNHELIRAYRTLGSKLFYGWEITLVNDGYAFIFSSLTKTLLKKSGLKEDLFNELLCGDKGMESVEPVRSIVKLAELVRADEKLKRELEKCIVNGKKLSFPSPVTRHPSLFQTLFETHLHKYGDRALAELKLESDSYRDRPEELIKLILSYVPTTLSIAEMEAKETEVRQKAEAEIAEKLKFKPFRRLALNMVLKQAKRAIRYRESSRLDRARSFGMVRKIFRTVGRNLFDNKALENPDDIYYLTVEEIADYIFGGSVNQSLGKIIRERRLLAEGYKLKSPAERLLTQGEPYLNFIVQKNMGHYENEGMLKGTGCSPGIITAEAVIVKDPAQVSDIQGKILVSEMTDPGWVFLMIVAGGLVVEKGSLLSHTAIIGRELGIPTIVGVKNATRLIENGTIININGQTGDITL